MTDVDTLKEEARVQAQRQWNTNPCGSLPTDAEDKAFFDRVEEDRYRQQYWQLAWMDYGRFAGQDVLEIGVGLGTDLKQFARAGARCHGVDITQRHLELTRHNFGLEGHEVDLRTADAAALPFADATFDCVHSFGVLHHIPDVDVVLAEVFRVLKPGGVMLNAVYHRWSYAAAWLFLKATLRGDLSRKGVSGVLATIEQGADGVLIKPYVRLYSKREWQDACVRAGFVPRRLAIRQVQSLRIALVNRLRWLEPLIGWYVAGEFVKPAS